MRGDLRIIATSRVTNHDPAQNAIIKQQFALETDRGDAYCTISRSVAPKKTIVLRSACTKHVSRGRYVLSLEDWATGTKQAYSPASAADAELIAYLS